VDMNDCQCRSLEGSRTLTVKTMKKYVWFARRWEIADELGHSLYFVISTVRVHIDFQFRAKTGWPGRYWKSSWENPKVHYCVHQNSSLVPILSQFNQSHTFSASIL
jgi:hypothetical protein